MKKLLIIDGNSIINRAFYGIRILTNKFGLCTNGIYGFLNIMFKHIEQLEPDSIAVAFDLKAPTFRHKMYSEYKAQRKGMPAELAQQMPVMKEILSAMNITILEKEGYEADDIIGTVSRICRETGYECYILTGDRDDLQLATDTTKILLTVTRGGATTTTEMDGDDVEDAYGVTPTQFIDVKGLMGDTSDNVPGVKGIGEKTAFEYIKKFKSIENLYKHLDDSAIKPAARRKLEEGRELAALSKTLCTIDTHVPISFSPEDAAVREYDNDRLRELFTNLEFSVFLKKLGSSGSGSEIPCLKCRIAEKDEDIKSALSDVGKELVYIMHESDGKALFAFLHGDEVCLVRGKSTDELVSIAGGAFADKNLLKISDDIKSHMLTVWKYGGEFSDSYFDTSVAAYIINPSKSAYDISSLAMSFISVSIPDDKEILGTGKSAKTFFEFSDDELSKCFSARLSAMKRIYEYEKNKVDEDSMQKLLYDIELPLVRVLASMEHTGVLVDKPRLEEFNESLKDGIAALENDIYMLAGEEFNINSPKQLGTILFEKLGLKAPKKTKTGYSTNAEVLEKLRTEHPIVEKILSYRQLAKLKSTYGDGLLAVIDPDTGRVYSKFNQTVTVTGRISSQEPNLQNIPVRTELGRELRKMFIAGDGCVLVDADYSQIELRVLAHLSGDEELIRAFNDGADIHSATAAGVFNVPIDEVTPLMRSRAKTVNFGIVYGMGDYSLAKDLGISVKEAREYIENYFGRYPGVKKYMDETVAHAKESGTVSTMFGRHRNITELSASNFAVRAAGERMARNTPIQGSAADIIKIAMVSVERALREGGYKSRLILQVHDELIIETAENEVDSVSKILRDCMQNAAKLSVPLVADTNSGHSWYDAK